ncbi:MAG: ribosome silencing factor [Acidimicrobiaceae bacterium]|nr:ribosome silencing factor [Acidimicrobiaceae bacterium]
MTAGANVAGQAGSAAPAGRPPAIEDGAYARRWAMAAAAAADERKGVDTVVIDVGDVLVVTDLFVVTHGNNARQVRAITEGVEESLRAAGGPLPLRIEGGDDRQWVLLDYGPFVVHVFDAERRDLYQLERLWGDCPLLDWRATAVSGV